MPSHVAFFPLTTSEVQGVRSVAINPLHIGYDCGACGESTNGRVVARCQREIDGDVVLWCLCPCPREEPTVIVERGGAVISQLPEAKEFKTGVNWPPELAQLFEEASRSYAAGANTAAAMVARKVLMACACNEGDTDGKGFAQYVEFITNTILTFPKAKDAIDKIRGIGNDANHKIRFVSREDARRALSIVSYMLNTIYSLPTA